MDEPTRTNSLNDVYVPRTIARLMGGALRSMAAWFDEVPPPSTLDDAMRAAAYSVEIALLEARANRERWHFTVLMLEERLKRLRNGITGNSTSRAPPSPGT